MTVSQQDSEVKYRIKSSVLEKDGISLLEIARARMCGTKSCPSCSSTDIPLETPKDVMRAIAQGCANQEGYFMAGMSILEVSFRVLLAKNNRPVSLDVLVAHLKQAWEEYIHLKNRHPAAIARVLNSHNDYGIERTS